MGTKFGLLVGAAAGYVLGTRAGRGRYEQIKTWAGKVRQSRPVAAPMDAASEKVAEAMRRSGEAASDKVAQFVKENLFGNRSDAARSQYVDVEVEEVDTADQSSPDRQAPRS